MKSLTKKVLSLAMAIAMAGSCMAFASDVTIGAVKDEGTTTVNIPYTTTETDQLTVIVYEVKDKNDETLPAIDTIGYINQFDAPAMAADATEATGTVKFTMKDDFVDLVNGVLAEGTYKIIMGGTGVGEAAVAYLVVGEEEVALTIADVDGDGDVTVADAIEIINYVNWETSLLDNMTDADRITVADIDSDSDVTVADAIEIINYVNWEPSILDSILN